MEFIPLKITTDNLSIFGVLVDLRGFGLLYEQDFAGVYSNGATPDPIPNSAVKSVCGDGIAQATVWESSTTPASFLKSRPSGRLFFLPEIDNSQFLNESLFADNGNLVPLCGGTRGRRNFSDELIIRRGERSVGSDRGTGNGDKVCGLGSSAQV